MGDVIVFPRERIKRHSKIRRCADCGVPLEVDTGETRCESCAGLFVDDRRKHLWSYIEHMVLRRPN